MSLTANIHLESNTWPCTYLRSTENGGFVWIDIGEASICVTPESVRAARELASRLTEAAEWLEELVKARAA